MHTDTKLPLVRLIVRLPRPVYDKLKEQSHTDAVPMAVLVRQALAARVALDDAPEVEPSP